MITILFLPFFIFQAFISYGPHDSAALLTEYGFLAPNNHHDAVPVSLDHLQLCFGLDHATIRSKSLALGLKIDACGICRPLCLLPHGPTFCLLQLLQELLRGPSGSLDEEDLLNNLQGPLTALLDQIQTDLLCELNKINATTRSYRQNCLHSLLKGREIILATCRSVIRVSSFDDLEDPK